MDDQERLKVIRRALWRFKLGSDFEDFVQSAWIKTRDLDDPRFIYQCTRQLVHAFYQTHNRRGRLLKTYRPTENPQPLPLANIMLDEIIKKARLSSDEKSLLYARFYQGQLIKEMAVNRGVTTQYISLLIVRILSKLRKVLNNAYIRTQKSGEPSPRSRKRSKRVG